MNKCMLTFVLQELIQEEAEQEMAVAQEVLNEEREKVCNVFFLHVNCKKVNVNVDKAIHFTHIL